MRFVISPKTLFVSFTGFNSFSDAHTSLVAAACTSSERRGNEAPH